MFSIHSSAGHTVSCASHLADGANTRLMAFVSGKDRVTLSSASPAAADGTASRVEVISFAQPGVEVTSVHVHPERLLLCIATADHGVYICEASQRVLDCELDRITVPPLSASQHGGANGASRVRDADIALFNEGRTTAVQFLCGSKEATPRLLLAVAFEADAKPEGAWDGGDSSLPKSLSKRRAYEDEDIEKSRWVGIIDVEVQALVWMETTPTCINRLAAFPADYSFVGCSRSAVYIWTARDASQPSSSNAAAVAAALVLDVRRETCHNIEELRDAEYTAVAVPSSTSNSSSSSSSPNGVSNFIALTAAGFLVCFDIHTGVGLKWMDCKVCPATGLCITPRYVVVYGELVRFFSTENWDFCGKIRLANARRVVTSSYLSNVMRSLCNGASVRGMHATFFLGSGELVDYQLGNHDPVKPLKLAFKKERQHVPIEQEEMERCLRWLPVVKPRKTQHANDVSAATSLCLWTPNCIRLLDSKLTLLRHCVIDTTCAVFQPELQVYVVFNSSTLEIVLLSGQLTEVGRLVIDEPLVSLAALSEGRFVGLTPHNMLFYFEGSVDGPKGAVGAAAAEEEVGGTACTISLECVTRRKLSSLPSSIRELLTVNGTLCGVGARSVINIGTSAHVIVANTIVHSMVCGNRLAVVHGNAVSFVDPDSMEVSLVDVTATLSRMPLASTPTEAFSNATCTMLAILCGAVVLLVNLTTGGLEASFPNAHTRRTSNLQSSSSRTKRNEGAARNASTEEKQNLSGSSGAADDNSGLSTSRKGSMPVYKSGSFTFDGLKMVLCDWKGILTLLRLPAGCVDTNVSSVPSDSFTSSRLSHTPVGKPPISTSRAVEKELTSPRLRRRSSSLQDKSAPTNDELANRLSTLGDYFKKNSESHGESGRRATNGARPRSASASRMDEMAAGDRAKQQQKGLVDPELEYGMAMTARGRPPPAHVDLDNDGASTDKSDEERRQSVATHSSGVPLSPEQSGGFRRETKGNAPANEWRPPTSAVEVAMVASSMDTTTTATRPSDAVDESFAGSSLYRGTEDSSESSPLFATLRRNIDERKTNLIVNADYDDDDDDDVGEERTKTTDVATEDMVLSGISSLKYRHYADENENMRSSSLNVSAMTSVDTTLRAAPPSIEDVVHGKHSVPVTNAVAATLLAREREKIPEESRERTRTANQRATEQQRVQKQEGAAARSTPGARQDADESVEDAVLVGSISAERLEKALASPHAERAQKASFHSDPAASTSANAADAADRSVADALNALLKSKQQETPTPAHSPVSRKTATTTEGIPQSARLQNLRESLLGLHRALHESSDTDQVHAAGAAQGTTDVLEDPEMSSLVSGVLCALQKMQWDRIASGSTRASRDSTQMTLDAQRNSAATGAVMAAAGVAATTRSFSGESNTEGSVVSAQQMSAVWSELHSLHEQNARIEAQNRDILARLSSLQPHQGSPNTLNQR